MAQKPTSTHGELYPCMIIKQEEEKRSHATPISEIKTTILLTNN